MKPKVIFEHIVKVLSSQIQATKNRTGCCYYRCYAHCVRMGSKKSSGCREKCKFAGSQFQTPTKEAKIPVRTVTTKASTSASAQKISAVISEETCSRFCRAEIVRNIALRITTSGSDVRQYHILIFIVRFLKMPFSIIKISFKNDNSATT